MGAGIVGLSVIRAVMFALVGLSALRCAVAAEPGAASFENHLIAARDVYGAAGQAVVVTPGRDAVVVDVSNGQAQFLARGAAGKIPSAKAVVVELKADGPGQPLANTSGYPAAFPRPNVKQLFDNARVTVWDYTWTMGVPPPTHFHTMPALPVFLADGALRSESPKGETSVTAHTVGHWRYQIEARLHTEHLDRGAARAIIIEFK